MIPTKSNTAHDNNNIIMTNTIPQVALSSEFIQKLQHIS